MPSVPTVREPEPDEDDGGRVLGGIATAAFLGLLAWILLAFALCRLA